MKHLLLFFLALSIFACGSDDDFVDMQECSTPPSLPNPCCAIAPLDQEFDNASVYIPNAFTPNGDGINDLFGPSVGDSINQMISFQILNDDQQEMFSITNVPNQELLFFWDGKYQDNIHRGHFTYEVRLRTTSGAEQSFSGEACSILCDGADIPLEAENIGNCAFPVQNNGMGSYDSAQPNLESEACLGG